MKSLLSSLIMTTAIVATLVASGGCGGGGHAGAPAAVRPGNGRAAVELDFSRKAASRGAEAATGTISVDVTITGYYGLDGSSFPPVTSSTQIATTGGHGKISMLEVPVGVNHLVTAIATWPDGAKDTIKYIIPEIVEGALAQGVADSRTTVIAEAAQALVTRDKTTLPKVTTGQIDALAEAVDAFLAAGYAPENIVINDVLSYSTNGKTITSVEVSPATVSVVVGATAQFTATPKNAYGLTVSGTVTWSVTGGIGSVSSGGLFTPTTAGSGTVVATSGTVSGSASVTVTVAQECGNGATETGEACDDGNTVTETCAYGQTSCSVCDATCQTVAGAASYCGDGSIDSANGESCDDGANNGQPNYCGSTCAGDTPPSCGNSVVETGETCDDGNTNTETCAYGQTSCVVCSSVCANVTGATSYCGDSAIDGGNGELCDDGANNGQPNYCGSACTGDTPASCGNSTIEAGETCDDGNTVTETCSYGQSSCSVCNAMCLTANGATSYCGDSVTDTANSEACDDGNAVTETCSYGQTSCTVCDSVCASSAGATSYCGDSVTDSANSETCDDGNAVTETCAYGQTSCTVCGSVCASVAGATSYCGDSVTDSGNGETCDDGNVVTEICAYGQTSCTVCDSVCASVSGSTSYCGDGITDAANSEACDDGNTTTETCAYGLTSCSVCDSVCASVSGATSYCGDTIIDAANSEACDDGVNNGTPNYCDGTCSAIAYVCTVDIDCDDADAYTLDTCLNGATLSATCANEAMACISDLECDDSDPNTYDACQNIGTTSAACSNLLMVSKISAGANYVCSVLSDGSAECWGRNDNGQLGTGCIGVNPPAKVAGAYDACSSYIPAPATVTGLSGVTSIGSGTNHTCALISDGSVKCWGFNYYGTLGDGVTTSSPTPVDATSLSGLTITDLSVGNDSTCVVLADGTARCWGGNQQGQLGNGTTSVGQSALSTVSGLTGAVDIELGYDHTCAIINDGTIKCWGNGLSGQLGNGITSPSYVPVSVSGITNAVSISLGNLFGCAVLSDGSAECWGNNQNGKLGIGNTTNSSIPVSIGLTNIVKIDAGYFHACALDSSNNVYCWGDDFYGQLGYQSNTQTNSTPQLLTAYAGMVADLSLGAYHTCLILTDSTYKCFGYDYNGQLGTGSGGYLIGAADNLMGLTGVTDLGIDEYTYFSCIVISGGVECWGASWYGMLGNNSYNSSHSETATAQISGTAVNVGSGYQHACAVLADGSVQCWGYNSNGQLGNGSSGADMLTPITVSGVSNAVKVTAGEYHTCALISDGTIQCWGANAHGQLGDGATTDSLVPVNVLGISNAVDVQSRDYWNCALLADGTMSCWGNNSNGQLGDGTTTSASSPLTVPGLANVVDFGAGLKHVCAVISDGTIKCWGMNTVGALGDGTTTQSLTPVSVLSISDAVDVEAGREHTCAILSTGNVQCWGANSCEQLGDGSEIDSSAPVDVLNVSGATQLGLSESLSCAITGPNNDLYCWGCNNILND